MKRHRVYLDSVAVLANRELVTDSHFLPGKILSALISSYRYIVARLDARSLTFVLRVKETAELWPE